MNSKVAISPNFYEQAAWTSNKLICGVDEAGRGCLAGPVVVGAVVLPARAEHPLLRDSKVMSAAQRDQAYDWITKNCYWQAAWAGVVTIERINIYQATKVTMLRCVNLLMAKYPGLLQRVSTVTIDAVPMDLSTTPHLQHVQAYHFNFGESLSTSIAAASIIAKVTRDRLLLALDKSFPAYQFAQHKGYGTEQHVAAVKSAGASIVHRTSFLGTILSEKSDQMALF